MSLSRTDAASVQLTEAPIDPTFSVAHKILCCIYLFQKYFHDIHVVTRYNSSDLIAYPGVQRTLVAGNWQAQV